MSYAKCRFTRSGLLVSLVTGKITGLGPFEITGQCAALPKSLIFVCFHTCVHVFLVYVFLFGDLIYVFFAIGDLMYAFTP